MLLVSAFIDVTLLPATHSRDCRLFVHITLPDSFPSLVGDVLVVTAFLSYCGPFNQSFRQSMIATWQKEVSLRKVPGSATVNLVTMLTDQTQVSRNASHRLSRYVYAVEQTS